MLDLFTEKTAQVNMPSTNAPEVRDFMDVDKMRDNITTGIMSSLQSTYPIKNDKYSLELKNLQYDNPKGFTLAEQKDAILKRKNLNWKIKGDWVLKDNATGKVLDSKPNTVVLHVPYMTDRGTFIYKGNEYTVTNQTRLKPGVYSRVKDSGELESHFNPEIGSGKAFRIFMEPETGVFRLAIGQAKIPLYSVLTSMGLKDADITNYWGEHGTDILRENKLKDDPNIIPKTIKKLGSWRSKITDPAEQIKDIFSQIKLDPDVTETTLGKRFNNVTPEVLLAATKKLLNISKGTAETDDRDSLGFQSVHSAEDFFKERIEKDSGKLAKKLLWQATFRGNLKHINSGALSPQLESVLISSRGIGQPLEEINPIEIVDQLARIIRTGEGGISEQSIPKESRSVQPSHLGFVDIFRGPESSKVGVDQRVAYGVLKGKDNQLYSRMLNAKTGKLELLPSNRAGKVVVAFPGELNSDELKVRAIKNGRVQYVDRNEVDYEVPNVTGMFGAGSNLVPLINGIVGQRLLMGGKMVNQALSLYNPESRYVQTLHPDTNYSFEELLGNRVGAVRSPLDGQVVSVTPDYIRVKTKEGIKKLSLYNQFPLNRKSNLDSTPVVKPGDRVKANQLLARSNYTDNNGVLALGKNLLTAYMPYKGLNYEDAVVISQSAANKLTSEHMYTHDVGFNDGTVVNKSRFAGLFPTTFNKQQLDLIDDKTGAAIPGTIVKKGDPLILALQPSRKTGLQQRKTLFNNQAVIWEDENPGLVTDVAITPKGVTVATKTYKPMRVGDKLAGFYGNKGVVAKIIPDSEMVRTKDGKVIDLILNPLGVISRTNSSQLVEAALGKIVQKTGQPYRLPSFMKGNLTDFALNELKKHGLTDTEDLIDPTLNNAKVKNIFVGIPYIMKLHHTADTKYSVGDDTGGYSQDMTPSKSGGGGKRIGNLEVNALLSHGTTNVIRDAKLVRGQRNDEYWKAFRMGLPPPNPQVPFIFEKFISALKGAGINVSKNADHLHIYALTDKDVDLLAGNRKITNPDQVDFKNLTPVNGGIFDPVLTGGHGGNRWSYIKLSEPLPNPIMEEPIRRILGNISKEKFKNILSGKMELNGKTGSEAVASALSNVDVNKELTKYTQIIKNSKGAVRDNAIKVIGYLKAAKEHGIHPSEFMLTKVPVIPPAFRPISMIDSVQMIADPNFLYKDLITANGNLDEMNAKLGKAHSGEERLAAYNAFKAVTGLGDPIHLKTVEKGAKGLLQHVFGCYDGETEVLTKGGWIKFKDYAGEDEICIIKYALESKKSVPTACWERPSAMHEYDFTGELIHINNRFIDLLITPNHNQPINKRQMFAIMDVDHVSNMTSSGSLLNDWKIKNEIVTADQLLQNNFRVSVSAVSTNDLKFKRMEGAGTLLGLMERFGRVNTKTGLIELYCKPSAALHSLLYKETNTNYCLTTNLGAINKYEIDPAIIIEPTVPANLLEYTNRRGGRFIRTFFKGFTNFYSENRIEVNKRVYEFLTRLAPRGGHYVELIDCDKEKNTYKVDIKPRRFVPIHKKEINLVPYTGKVYCCTVSSGLIIVRRNGKVVMSGNSSPKYGLFQHKLIGMSVNVTGRAAITPNPSLNMDEVGLPEEQAWKIYSPFIMRNLLTKKGVQKSVTALRMIEDKDATAKQTLLEEMQARPLVINRAPVLHRYGIMAAWPKIVPGDTLQLSPIVTSGFGADFDGDAMNYHVPVTTSAVKEAIEKMLPSKNILNISDFGVTYAPSQEYLHGLYVASSKKTDKSPRVFSNVKDVIMAIRRGELDPGDPVEVKHD